MKIYLQLNEPGSGEISVPLENSVVSESALGINSGGVQVADSYDHSAFHPRFYVGDEITVTSRAGTERSTVTNFFHSSIYHELWIVCPLVLAHILPATISKDNIQIGRYIQVAYRGDDRQNLFVENIKRVQVNSTEGGGRWLSVSGRGILSLLDDAIVWDDGTASPSRLFSAKTRGYVLKTLIDEAKARGCFPLLDYDFSATVDSLGTAWADSETYDLRVGTSYLDVCRQFADLGNFDVEMVTGNLGRFLLRSYQTGKGSDLSATIHFRIGENCEEVGDDEQSSELRNALRVEYSNGFATASDAASIAKYRRREGLFPAANAGSSGSASSYGTAELSITKDPKRKISVKITDATGPRVFVDYDLGDWVMLDNNGVEEKYRIIGMALEWSGQWYADVIVDLNSTIQEADIRVMRQLRKLASSSMGSNLATQSDPKTAASNAVETHDVDANAHGNMYVKHSLATAVNDFLVASGAGAFVKKTLAEVKTLLDIISSTNAADLTDGGETTLHKHRFVNLADAFASFTGLGGKFVRVNAAENALETATIAGGGDVLGPATSTDGHMAVWDGTDSKTLKDGGATSSGDGSGVLFDVAPVSPHAKDDEFNGGSLDGKWTDPVTSTRTNTIVIANGWLSLEPSDAGTGSTGSRGGYGIRQTAPTGSFTVTAKIIDIGSDVDNDDSRVGIFIARSSATAYTRVLGHQTGVPRLANVNGIASYSESGDWGAYDGVNDQYAAQDNIDVRIGNWYKAVWDATAGTISFYYSANGVFWRLLTTHTGLTQPDRIGLVIWANTANIRADHRLGCDWFRVTEP